MADLRGHIDRRFDSLETKLDDHLERLSKAEEAINWLKGHVKLSTAVGLAVIGSILGYIFKL